MRKKFKKDYEWVKNYIESKFGYEVVENSKSEERVEFEDREVYISSRNRIETRYYTLLHEYGHIEIHETGSEEFEADHPMYYRVEDGRVERSNACKVSIVAEEIEAWKRGRWLARNNNLSLNEKKYDQHMTRALMSYINWAANS